MRRVLALLLVAGLMALAARSFVRWHGKQAGSRDEGMQPAVESANVSMTELSRVTRCTDRVWSNTSQHFEEISARFVVPQLPAHVDHYSAKTSFGIGLRTALSGGYFPARSSLAVTLQLRLRGRAWVWTVEACGFNTFGADESGNECNAPLVVNAGEMIRASITFDGRWVLTGTEESTGKQAWVSIKDLGWRGDPTEAYVYMGRMWGTSSSHSGELECNDLPASNMFEFLDISVNHTRGRPTETSSECEGQCGSRMATDESSVKFTWNVISLSVEVAPVVF